VTSRLDPIRFTIRTTPKRIRRDGDPLKGVFDERVDVDALLTALTNRLDG
jgi:DNA primase